MNLDEAQKKIVSGWIAEGQKLSDIQKRLASELGLTLTYMQVRLLVDDLRLTPKDVEPPKTAELPRPAPSSSAPPPTEQRSAAPSPLPEKTGGAVTVKVDELARPGAVVSGTVRFSDGNTAEWYLDQMGRLGLMPKQQGYRPSQADVAAFQTELQTELARFGF
jgi:hypothetical protein